MTLSLLGNFALISAAMSGRQASLVGDGQTRSSVVDIVTENGLAPGRDHDQAIAHSQVPEMISIADVAVVPSAPITASRGGTGTPLKLFEYMAAGKAIVATASNETAEVIQHGHNGLLVEAGDFNKLAEAILTLLNDPVERVRLGQNARQQAIELYSWEQYTRRLEEIYDNILVKAPSGSPITEFS
jgi:glycosyltransferase involved in cell wall biosynthesis